jgi:hypothetical protein
LNKPDPIIEKIEFSKEDQESIDAILSGKPSAKTIQRWKDAGFNIEHRIKWYISIPQKERMLRIRQKYKISGCHVCQQFPLYKVLYKLPDITLVEYWCEKHFDKII